MSVNALVLGCSALALLAVVDADQKGDVSRRVVDGVLSLLGVNQQSEEDGSTNEVDGDTGVADPGERGIHKKKILYHLWATFYWWAWAFAVIVIKFKVVMLVLWGHLTYFVVAFIRMLLRELKRDGPPVYGPPAPAYGPPPAYGPQYGAQPQQYGSSSYASAASAYKRRAGAAAEATPPASAGHDLAYGAHARR